MKLLLACRIWLALLHNALLKLGNCLQDTAVCVISKHHQALADADCAAEEHLDTDT